MEKETLLKRKKIVIKKDIKLSNSKQGINMEGKLGICNFKEDYIFNNKKGTQKSLEVIPQTTHFFEKNKFQKYLPTFAKPITKDINRYTVRLTSNLENKEIKSLGGLYSSLFKNIAHGVTEAYRIKLKLVGVGYRAVVKDIKDEFNNTKKILLLKLGYSHQISIEIPQGIIVLCTKPTFFSIIGTDLEQVSQFAKKIRSFREPEPYKGKGVLVQNEKIIKKESKKK